jgi:hypothetical protein
LIVLRIAYKFISRLGIFALAITLFSITTLAYTVEQQTPAKPAIGIVYWYYYDDTLTITSELEKMKADGFQIICIPYVWWSDDPQSPWRVQTDTLYTKAAQLGLKIYVREPDPATLEKYLNAYASKISYFQVINEADARFLKEWNVPGELTSIAWKNAETIKKFNQNIKTVASFSTPLFPDLVSSIAQHVDIIALDIYEQLQLDTFPVQMQTLLTLSGKHTIWIGEFGYATLDDQQQADFLLKGLNLFKANGVEAVIVWSWNTNVGLEIKGRLAETTIRKWVTES